MAKKWPKNGQKWPFLAKNQNFFFSIDSTPYWLVPPKIWIFSLKNCWLCKVYRNKPEKQTAPLAVLAILSQSILAVFLSINLAIFANLLRSNLAVFAILSDQIWQFLLFLLINLAIFADFSQSILADFNFLSINLAIFAILSLSN